MQLISFICFFLLHEEKSEEGVVDSYCVLWFLVILFVSCWLKFAFNEVYSFIFSGETKLLMA